MKTSIFFLGLLSAATRFSAAPAAPAGPPCCAVELKPDAPLSARSIYLLDAAWTNDTGATFRLAALRGRPVVLAMFFAQCEYACPILVRDMSRVRASLPEAVRAQTQFVMVSFDTARDTPAALRAYRERMALDADWTLLRGDTAVVQELAMLLGVKFKQDARGQFSHSNLFTVLNREGEIAHQQAGLQGEVSESVKAISRLVP
ncbi:MAG: SCO family protein [Opitutaceae bacterium]